MTVSATWPNILSKLVAGENLSRAEATWSLDEIMSGQTDAGIIAAFMIALRAKGETVDEISGLVDAMLTNSLKLDVSSDALDIVGTGGDMFGTVNVSSMASIVAASVGVPVLKHGSRSASGKTGSSEFLEELGVRLDLDAKGVAKVFAEVGITFFFAPVFHPAMKFVAPVRRLLGVPTTFNFLGPLANPAQPVATSLGVSNPEVAPLMAREMAARGRTALVFRGNDGLDELTTTDSSQIWQVVGGLIREFELNPAKLGLATTEMSTLIGGDAAENAEIAKQLLAGSTAGDLGAVKDIVLLNAAGGVVAYEMAHDSSKADVELELRLSDALQKVTVALESGAAAQKLNAWVSATTKQ